jgi:NADH dehydrogenase (ubiquinone) Fe-S protein 1
VGALTSKPYAFKARPWELRLIESIDLSDSLGSNIYLNFKESEIVRILPKNNININENWITDKARFSFDALKTKRLMTPLFFNNTTNLWKKNKMKRGNK